MKVLMLNGSAKPQGNTYRALYEVGEQLKKEGIDYEIFQIGAAPLRDCIGCGQCTEKGCVFDDDKVNEFVAKAKEADGLVFGTPVYYAHPSNKLLIPRGTRPCSSSDLIFRLIFPSSASGTRRMPSACPPRLTALRRSITTP